MPFATLRFSVAFLFSVLVLLPYNIICEAGETSSLRLNCVVLDAGHGGKDPGTVYGKVREKDINLDVVLKLGSLISEGCPDVKVVYTRDDDTFISLADRSDKANHCHADLFISVHVNSVKGTSQVNGSETFVMGPDKGNSNMEVCKRENSVILLEDDHSARYQGFDPDDPASYILFSLMQSAYFDQSLLFASMVQENLKKGPVKNDRGIKQAPLFVLWKTTMPSVLVEIGFLSSQRDRPVLSNPEERDRIARCLYEAFLSFKRQYDADVPSSDNNSSLSDDEKTEHQSVADTVTNEQRPVVVGAEDRVDSTSDGPKIMIQIMAARKEIPKGAYDFRGVRDYVTIHEGNLYKYFLGPYRSRQEAADALPDIRKKFKGAYIVTLE